MSLSTGSLFQANNEMSQHWFGNVKIAFQLDNALRFHFGLHKEIDPIAVSADGVRQSALAPIVNLDHLSSAIGNPLGDFVHQLGQVFLVELG